jgi:5-methylthioadenosine/S-adenosylhomocysteine deaminase
MSATTTVDLIVSAKWILPVLPENEVLVDHSIVVHESKIVAIAPTDSVLKQYEATSFHDLRDNQVLMPGFVNAHTHTPMTLLRGFVDNVELIDWLEVSSMSSSRSAGAVLGFWLFVVFFF